jgi:glucokinase
VSTPRSLVLAGDVGGTKLNLGLARTRGEGLEVIAEERYESDDFDGLVSAVRSFLDQHEEDLSGGSIEQACFGVAGPVLGERSVLTNLPWRLDEDTLENELGIGEILFLNDLEATAYGLTTLSEDRLSTLHRGRVRGSTRAVIAAGTIVWWRRR